MADPGANSAEHDHDGDHHSSDASAPMCPVCRMGVDVANAPRAEFGGRTFYFCNAKCERTFHHNPTKFAARAV